MPIKNKTPEPTADDVVKESITELLERLSGAHKGACALFDTDTPTAEMVLGVFERVECYEKERDQEDAADELLACITEARTNAQLEALIPGSLAERSFFLHDVIFGEEE